MPLEIPWLDWPETIHAAERPGPRMRLPETPGPGFEPNFDVIERNVIDRARIE